MIGVRYPSERNRRCNSKPSVPGIRTSRMRHSVSSIDPEFRNSSTEAKLWAWWPADLKIFMVDVRTDSSSSTTEIKRPPIAKFLGTMHCRCYEGRGKMHHERLRPPREGRGIRTRWLANAILDFRIVSLESSARIALEPVNKARATAFEVKATCPADALRRLSYFHQVDLLIRYRTDRLPPNRCRRLRLSLYGFRRRALLFPLAAKRCRMACPLCTVRAVFQRGCCKRCHVSCLTLHGTCFLFPLGGERCRMACPLCTVRAVFRRACCKRCHVSCLMLQGRAPFCATCDK